MYGNAAPRNCPDGRDDALLGARRRRRNGYGGCLRRRARHAQCAPSRALNSARKPSATRDADAQNVIRPDQRPAFHARFAP